MSPAVTQVSVTLDSMLAEAAAARPDQAALILPRRGPGERTIGFAELDSRVTAIAAGLQASGLRPGMRAAVLVPPTEDFFALIFGLLRLRAVPILIDPGIGRAHLATCLAEAEPDAFIGIAKAHLGRRLLHWCPEATLAVTVGAGPRSGLRLAAVEALGRSSQPPDPAVDPDALAAVVFTSGSTGVPKGVEATQATLLAQTTMIAALYGLGADDVSLATFPVFALFGPPLGMTTVVPRMDPTKPASARPARIIQAANKHRATVMFGSPALLETLTRGADGARMPTVRQVISAGAPVGRPVQRAVLRLLGPGAQVHSPYGATEALPVSTIGSSELLGLPADGICVGRPVPGVDLAIIAITDEPIAELTPELAVPTGQMGEVVVRGPNVTRAYINRPGSTAEAKLDWDGTIAHRMGDLARLDADGRLWFGGRKAHRVVTASGTLFSVPVEEIFNTHPEVRRTALVGIGDPGRQTPVLCVELATSGRIPVRKASMLRARVTVELLELAAADPDAAQVGRIVYHPSFPVDIRHNAKIDRPALARWVEAGQPGRSLSGRGSRRRTSRRGRP